MPKRRHYVAQKRRQQLFDSSIKGLMEQAPKLIECFLQGAVYQKTLNVEIIRPPLRADRVCQGTYLDQDAILHFECQVSYDPQLQARLLSYCSDLYLMYGLPVICLVIYLFPTTITEPPLCIISHGKVVIMLDYQILLLFEEDATKYVERHNVCAYPLLPAMQGVDARLMKQVGEELKAYYHGQESVLRDQFTWMRVFLKRTKTVTDEEKQKIEEVLNMLGLEQLWDESPLVQAERAKSRAEALAEGLEVSRSIALKVVNLRFPALMDLAHRKLSAITQLSELRALVDQIVEAPDEQAVRELLLPQQLA